MGSKSSVELDAEEQTKRTLKAARNYHRRINEYHYAYHGCYRDYIEWCNEQYELECLPEYRGKSKGVKRYDMWGIEILIIISSFDRREYYLIALFLSSH
jgi:hypothetical protein